MWPKMLLELLPHFARLMPVADKYLNSRSASDKAQEAALAALAEEVRGSLDTFTEAHAGLWQQAQQQSTQVGELAVEVTRARLGVESVEARVARLEKKIASMIRLLAGAAHSASVVRHI
jgi:phage shock protein A